VSGDAGSNECPAGSVRIETEAACRTAVAAAGKTAGSNLLETRSGFPKGCYYDETGVDAFFNTHFVGAGRSGWQLLCAALATTGAPLMPPMRARVCTGACSGTARVRVWFARGLGAVCALCGSACNTEVVLYMALGRCI
jgi:hypothetical protein